VFVYGGSNIRPKDAFIQLPEHSGSKIKIIWRMDNMVNAAKQKTFFAGVSTRDIFADPF
jgi:hypothetical protein